MIIEFLTEKGRVSVRTIDVKVIKERFNEEDGALEGVTVILADNQVLRVTQKYEEAREVWSFGLQALTWREGPYAADLPDAEG